MSFRNFAWRCCMAVCRAKRKKTVMRRFKSGEVQILVSTTVVEVGVDVPNATVMLIEHAERFGLSQLHQLRGRIGRGKGKSFCLLLAGDAAHGNRRGAPEHHRPNHRRISHRGDRFEAARPGRILWDAPVGHSGVANRQPDARPGDSGMGQARRGGFPGTSGFQEQNSKLMSLICARSGRAAMGWRRWRNKVV